MAKKIYTGVDGIARQTKKMYVGVEGVARKVKKAYVGVNNVAELFFGGISNILDENDWQTISEVSAAGTASNYWNVGDTKAITLNGTVGTLSLSNVKLYVYILGFDHNSTLEGSGISFGMFKTAQTGGTDVALIDSNYWSSNYNGTKYFQMNHWGSASSPYNTNYGGWAACDMRYDILGSTDVAPSPYGSVKTTSATGSNPSSTCTSSPKANTLMAALPSDLRSVLKPITKYTDNKGNGSSIEANVTATIDYLPLLSEFEVHGVRSHANAYEQNKQVQYRYYQNGNNKGKYCYGSSTPAMYLQRSPINDNYRFNAVPNVPESEMFSHGVSASESFGLTSVFLV